MAASSMQVLAGTLLVDDGTGVQNSVPTYDANGHLFTIGGQALNLTTTGTAAGSLSLAYGAFTYNGTSTATYTLPSEAQIANRRLTILNQTTSALTLAPFSGQTINGSTNTVTVPTNTASTFNAARTVMADPSTNTGTVVF